MRPDREQEESDRKFGRTGLDLSANDIEAARRLAPGWDVYALEADWRASDDVESLAAFALKIRLLNVAAAGDFLKEGK